MFSDLALQATRRNFFGSMGLRMGSLALATMAAKAGWSSDGEANRSAHRVHPPLPGLPHFAPKATSIIYLHMNGGPSQLDTWDYKPKLVEYFDQDLPPSVRGEQRLSTMTSGQTRFPVAPSKFKFEQKGQSGIWANVDLMPHTSKIVDEITLIKTVSTNAINHDPACTFVMTGSEVPARPALDRGFLTDLEVKTTTYRLSSSLRLSSPATATDRRFTTACGEVVFCRHDTTVLPCEVPAIRYSTFRTRKVSCEKIVA